MTVEAQSASTAYASKPNIVYPGTSARAALVATLAGTRLADDPNRVVFGSQTVLVDQAAGAGESQVALPVA